MGAIQNKKAFLLLYGTCGGDGAGKGSGRMRILWEERIGALAVIILFWRRDGWFYWDLIARSCVFIDLNICGENVLFFMPEDMSDRSVLLRCAVRKGPYLASYLMFLCRICGMYAVFILFLRWYYERIGCWLCQLFYDIMQWLWTVFYMIVSCFICRGSYILRQKKIDGDENDVQRFLGDWTFYENHKFSYGYISMPTVAALPDQRCFLHAGWADFFSRYVAI